eukprot:gene25463-biopygen13521
MCFDCTVLTTDVPPPALRAVLGGKRRVSRKGHWRRRGAGMRGRGAACPVTPGELPRKGRAAKCPADTSLEVASIPWGYHEYHIPVPETTKPSSVPDYHRAEAPPGEREEKNVEGPGSAWHGPAAPHSAVKGLLVICGTPARCCSPHGGPSLQARTEPWSPAVAAGLTKIPRDPQNCASPW